MRILRNKRQDSWDRGIQKALKKQVIAKKGNSRYSYKEEIKRKRVTSLAVQWLGLPASTAGGLPDQRTRALQASQPKKLEDE